MGIHTLPIESGSTDKITYIFLQRIFTHYRYFHNRTMAIRRNRDLERSSRIGKSLQVVTMYRSIPTSLSRIYTLFHLPVMSPR